MRRILIGLALAAAIVTSAPVVHAADKREIPADVDSKALKSAQESFKRGFDTADIEFKLRALTKYSKVQHKTIGKALIKMLKSKDQYVRAGAAKGLSYQLSSVKSAGPKLKKLAETQRRGAAGLEGGRAVHRCAGLPQGHRGAREAQLSR